MEVAGLALAIPPMIVLCAAAIREVRNVVETIKTANKTLMVLLSRVERMRLFLDALRGLATQMTDPKQQALLLTFGENEYRNTLREIRDLIRQVATYCESPWRLRAYWVTQKHKAVGLIKQLHEHEAELVVCLSIISTKANLNAEQHIAEMQNHFARQSMIQDKFRAFNPTEDDEDFADDITLADVDMDVLTTSKTMLPIWPGYVLTTGLSREYIHCRNRVSDAAYCGKWEQLLDALQEGERLYDEAWGSCVRLKPEHDAHRISFWTPLHQAATFGAPLGIVQHIKDRYHGLTTLRTRWAEPNFIYHDLTPSELARQNGHILLAEELAPTIYHTLPVSILAILQAKFHAIIRDDLQHESWTKLLVLPDLAALTELKDPDMWFPIQGHRGYRFCLDGRELIVCKFGVADQESKYLRIRSDGRVVELERVVVFDHDVGR